MFIGIDFYFFASSLDSLTYLEQNVRWMDWNGLERIGDVFV